MTRYSVLKRARKGVGSLLRAVVIIEIGFIVLYPVLYMLSMAFRTPEQMHNPNVVWIPTSLTMDNIKQVWDFMEYPKAAWTTVYLDVFCAVFQTVVCCVVGYGFARFPIRGKKLLFMLVIFTMIIPPSTTIISSYLQYRSFDVLYIVSGIRWLFTGQFEGIRLLNSPLVMWLPALSGMGIRSGLFIFIYRQFFLGMPKELEEAAYIDGSGPFKCFLRIMVPNAKSAIVTVFLFSLVWYYNDTFFSTTYLDSVRTISTSLQYLNENLKVLSPVAGIFDRYQVVTLVQAACLLTIAPLTIFYIFMQRLFTESVERTGIVG